MHWPGTGLSTQQQDSILLHITNYNIIFGSYASRHHLCYQIQKSLSRLGACPFIAMLQDPRKCILPIMHLSGQNPAKAPVQPQRHCASAQELQPRPFSLASFTTTTSPGLTIQHQPPWPPASAKHSTTLVMTTTTTMPPPPPQSSTSKVPSLPPLLPPSPPSHTQHSTPKLSVPPSPTHPRSQTPPSTPPKPT